MNTENTSQKIIESLVADSHRPEGTSWDEKYFYIEHKFEVAGRLHAHAFVKGVFLKGGKVVPNTEIVGKAGHTGAPPPMPEALRLWAELGSAKRPNGLVGGPGCGGI